MRSWPTGGLLPQKKESKILRPELSWIRTLLGDCRMYHFCLSWVS